MAQLQPLKGGYYIWHYLPSRTAAGIFSVLFFICFFVHMWRMIRTRTWFCIALTIGVFLEAAGFAIRIQCYNHTDKLSTYIMQSMFILLAPILFAATIYMTLSRIIRSVPDGEHCSPIQPRKLTRYFVIGDIASLGIQGNSTPLNFIANGKYAKWGNVIVIAGLVVQFIMFGLFMVTAIVFDRRYQRKCTAENSRGQMYDRHTGRPMWKRNLLLLYAASVLIMIRSAYRVIEFALGQDGYLMTHEWSLYVFDAVLMWTVTVLYAIWYPSNFSAMRTQRATMDDTEYIALERPAVTKH